jgi:hypothetical protein
MNCRGASLLPRSTWSFSDTLRSLGLTENRISVSIPAEFGRFDSLVYRSHGGMDLSLPAVLSLSLPPRIRSCYAQKTERGLSCLGFVADFYSLFCRCMLSRMCNATDQDSTRPTLRRTEAEVLSSLRRCICRNPRNDMRDGHAADPSRLPPLLQSPFRRSRVPHYAEGKHGNDEKQI